MGAGAGKSCLGWPAGVGKGVAGGLESLTSWVGDQQELAGSKQDWSGAFGVTIQDSWEGILLGRVRAMLAPSRK